MYVYLSLYISVWIKEKSNNQPKIQNKLNLHFCFFKSLKMCAVQSFLPVETDSLKKLLKAPNYQNLHAFDERK